MTPAETVASACAPANPEAREALAAYIASTGYTIQYDEQVLDLAVTRPRTDLERYLGEVPVFTFLDLVNQAEQWEALASSQRAN